MSLPDATSTRTACLITSILETKILKSCSSAQKGDQLWQEYSSAILHLFGRFNVRLFVEIASGFICRNIDEGVHNNFRNII